MSAALRFIEVAMASDELLTRWRARYSRAKSTPSSEKLSEKELQNRA